MANPFAHYGLPPLILNFVSSTHPEPFLSVHPELVEGYPQRLNKKPPAWEAFAFCFKLSLVCRSVQLLPGSPAGRLKKKKKKKLKLLA
jgi:hypothetical protein